MLYALTKSWSNDLHRYLTLMRKAFSSMLSNLRSSMIYAFLYSFNSFFLMKFDLSRLVCAFRVSLLTILYL